MEPFTNSHFHFHIVVELMTCQTLFQWPKNMVDGPDICNMTAIALMSNVCCVGFHCHAVGSHLVTGHLFGLLK
jgi:hypothetical protein